MSHSSKQLHQREQRDSLKDLRAEVANLSKELAASLAREKQKDEEIAYLMKKLYGTSSEKRTRPVEGQVAFFNEVEAEAEKPLPAEEEKEIVQFERRKKSKTPRDEQLKGLQVKEKVIPLSDEDRICKECGAAMLPAGKKLIRRELVMIPAKVYIREIYAETAYCPECKKECAKADSDRKNNIVNAKVPEPLISGSMATESIVAHGMYQKYVNAVPLYRQEKDWQQMGIFLSRGRLASWINVCSEEYFVPIYEYFHRLLLGREFGMADETRVQVLKEPNRKPETDSFMWLFRSGEDGLPSLILYHYTETRARYNAEAFLKGYKGYLMTDGYQGYNNLPGIKRTCCWAHVRRDFYDAIPAGKDKDYSLPAVQGTMYCDKLFEVEKHCRQNNYSPEQRYEYRLKRAKPILEAFWVWLDGQLNDSSIDPKSRLGKALSYANNRRAFLDVYLQDGRCSFSNNPSENSIRPFVVGRKNWLFSDTPKGAKASAVVYTIVEMAKAHGLNVERYLTFLLKSRPNREMTDEELERLSPWSQEARDYCSHDHTEDEE